jgi:DNA helicase II / ATP-dependent DNA helicase PcrA
VPSNSRVVIAAAGGGKTTRIAAQALSEGGTRTALVTYTRNNVGEIERKIYERSLTIPAEITILSWYAFLLREMARPYRNSIYPRRIDGLAWVEGRSPIYAKEADTAAHYFADGRHMYADKIAKFVCKCETVSGGAVLRRLTQRFDHIIIDEIQDMAGYDLDLLEMLLKSQIRVTMVGDHRQSTYTTNNAARNSAYAGIKIIKKFEEWKKAGLVDLEYDLNTRRCQQTIADLADSFFPDQPKTKSLNSQRTGHDGIFAVPEKFVPMYVERFRPQVLRYSKATSCGGYDALNFGESKGMTFDRVLIYPHGKAKSWLASDDLKHVLPSASKMYVGATRARHSVAFVFDGAPKIPNITQWDVGGDFA